MTKDQVVEPAATCRHLRLALGRPLLAVPARDPARHRHQVGQTDTDLYKQIQCDPFVDFSTLEAVIVLVRKPRHEVILDCAKSAALVFVAAILQVSVFSDVRS